jgi:ATP phosphoribosyltransferase regulatory subunit HisZ
MRYYIGAEARLRRTVEDVAMSVFQAWNYEEVITPSVDYYDLFEQGMGQREAQRGFRFTDNDGRSACVTTGRHELGGAHGRDAII